MRSVLLGWACSALFALVGSLPGQQCSTCQQVTDSGGPVNDACTTLIVTWLGSSPGSCKFNPAPKCIANENCLFSLRVEIVDNGCGFYYGQTYCTQHVDTNGMPVGGEACTAESLYFPNPSVVSDYPVVCGRVDTWVFRRHHATQPPEGIGSPSGTCKACPSQVYGVEEGG